MRRYLILIILLLVLLVPIGLLALGVIKRPVRTPNPVPLTMWVMSDATAYRSIINQFNAVRPYIRVTIEEVPREDYATKLKDAWARGKGPDLFELPASSIGEFATDFLSPMPAATTVYTYRTKKVLFRSEIEVSRNTIASITAPQLQQQFVDVVSDDVLRGGQIYGLPLAIDTLVLYYNRDLLRGANIVAPPTSWLQLTSLVPKLTSTDDQDKVIQSGIAIGTGKNVTHSADIMSLLMLQDGVTLNGVDGQVNLDDSVTADGQNLGVNALSFYTSFANPNKPTYAWNAEQPESRDAFVRGKSAMYIGYGTDRPYIDANTSVNYGIAAIPHLTADGKDSSPSGASQQVNYGNYNVLAVFQRSAYANEAWNLIQFLTRQDAVAKPFLAATKRVGALRTVVAEQAADPEVGVFAQQAVSARSWYRGRSASATEQALRDMIDNVAGGKSTPIEALSLARRQIELTTRTIR
ncbi:MAG: extracellular solute-binding protein [Candidatus Kerfeldbacteria bacterium]|nr:extracellular solute-binding protein [Candidatus Kerfeldbacteria bacterium]